MCPVCVASMALTAVGATSGGGLAAFVLNKFCRKKQTNQTKREQNETSRNGIQSRSGLGSGMGGTDKKEIMHGNGPTIAWFKDPTRNILPVVEEAKN